MSFVGTDNGDNKHDIADAAERVPGAYSSTSAIAAFVSSSMY